MGSVLNTELTENTEGRGEKTGFPLWFSVFKIGFRIDQQGLEMEIRERTAGLAPAAAMEGAGVWRILKAIDARRLLRGIDPRSVLK